MLKYKKKKIKNNKFPQIKNIKKFALKNIQNIVVIIIFNETKKLYNNKM